MKANSPSSLTVEGSSTVVRTPIAAGQSYAGGLDSAGRMAVLRNLNSMAGYSAATTILPEGTALWDVGEENLRRHKADINSLPTMLQFSQAFLAAEQARDLKDVNDTMASMRMRPDSGKIFRVLPNGSAGGAVGYTMTGLSQMLSLYREHLGLPNGAAATLAYLSPKARAEAFNDISIRAQEKMIHVRELPDRVFRTALNPHGERYLRAVTSKQHCGIAGGYAAMVRQLAKMFPEAKARAVRTEDRFDLDLIFPMHSREIKVGDVLHGTLGITLSETKDVRAAVRDALLRVLCANLTVRSYGKDAEFSRRHVGVAFVRDLATRIQEGWNRLSPFVEAFGDAYKDPFVGSMTRATTVERTFKVFNEDLKAISAESVIQAWDLDGMQSAGNTRAGLVNALTRASQVINPESAEKVEAVAGRIIEQGWAALG